jgi:hypothetical protein
MDEREETSMIRLVSYRNSGGAHCLAFRADVQVMYFVIRVLLWLGVLLLQSCGGGAGLGSGGAGSGTAVPLAVDINSWVNKSRADALSSVVPNLSVLTAGAYQSRSDSLAVADFLQVGQNAAFVVGVDASLAAKAFFLKVDPATGVWVDVSDQLFASGASQRQACSDPRQGLVTQFNSDTRPDVFLVCGGGSDQYAYISGPDGKYSRYKTNYQANATSAATADLDDDGRVDIITTDGGWIYKIMGVGSTFSGIVMNSLSPIERISGLTTALPSAIHDVFVIARNGTQYLLVGGQGNAQNEVAWYKNFSGAFDSAESRRVLIPGALGNYRFDYLESLTDGYLYVTSATSSSFVNLLRMTRPQINPVTNGWDTTLYRYSTGSFRKWPATAWAARVVLNGTQIVPYDAQCLGNAVNAASDERCGQAYDLSPDRFTISP